MESLNTLILTNAVEWSVLAAEYIANGDDQLTARQKLAYRMRKACDDDTCFSVRCGPANLGFHESRRFIGDAIKAALNAHDFDHAADQYVSYAAELAEYAPAAR